MKKICVQLVLLAVSVSVSAKLASADITYTCDPTIAAEGPANTCATLNTLVSGLYSSTFSNANANIYIQYGTTGLGQSTTGFDSQISFSAYVAALTADSSGNALDMAALASLAPGTPAFNAYSGGMVDIPNALGVALGIANMTGTTAGGTACTVGTAGCYNGIITITNPADLLSSFGQTLYYRNGVQDPNSYDFYSIVEHETDEVLGTSSCVDTTGGALADNCPGTNTPAAVDLFRYNGANNPVLIDTTPGAYFSFNGGATNGADGAIYNTVANGDDYADFVSNCAFVQDGTGCLGSSLDITTDGGAEINILDAVGYNRIAATPEPGTVGLFGTMLAVFAAIAYRRNRRAGMRS